MPREIEYTRELVSMFDTLKAEVRTQTLVLGGSSGSGGGGGGPVGGLVGQLPQIKVAGDTDESKTELISSGSIASLLDNLKNIRYWETTQIAVSAPSPTFAGQLWVDTSGSSPYPLYIRNAGDTNWFSIDGAPRTSQAIFSTEGVLSTGSGNLRIYNELGRTVTISKVFLAVNTPSSGSSIICDVNNSSATIFSNQAHRPEIAAGAYTGYTTTIDLPTWADGEYLTFDRDAIGSSTPGSDLTVHITYS